jgi:hypothetical protein
MSRLALSTLLAAAVLAATTTPSSATPIDKLNYMTFSKSVQIPGAVLDAGTYRFRLADPTSSRQVMQVLSNDGSIVYSMFYTREDWRSRATDAPTVTFRETPAGVPPAVRSLFYGGETRGYEFVYAKGELQTIPKAVSQPPVTYTPTPTFVWPWHAPNPEEVSSTPAAVPEPAPALSAEYSALPAEPIATPAETVELPQTASPLPLVTIAGLLMLLTGLGAGLIRSRT